MKTKLLPLGLSLAMTASLLAGCGGSGDELDVIPIFYQYAASWIAMNGIVDMTPYMDTEDGQKIIDALGVENAYVGRMGDTLFGFPAAKESVDLGGLVMRADITTGMWPQTFLPK